MNYILNKTDRTGYILKTEKEMEEMCRCGNCPDDNIFSVIEKRDFSSNENKFSRAFNINIAYNKFTLQDRDREPVKLTINKFEDRGFACTGHGTRIEIKDGFCKLDYNEAVYILDNDRVVEMYVPSYQYIIDKIGSNSVIIRSLRYAMTYYKLHRKIIICNHQIAGERFLDAGLATYDSETESYTIKKEHEEAVIDYYNVKKKVFNSIR